MEKSEAQAVAEMTKTKGWAVLRVELENEIGEIENAIFRIDWWEWNDIKFSENDLLKRTRNLYRTLLESPQEILDSFQI